MFNYVIGFKNQKQVIQAEDSYSAMKRAIEIYKPNKKDRYLVWVELISKEVTDAQFR